MEDRLRVDLGGENGSRKIWDFEAAALESGDPVLFFPLSGLDARKGAVGWIDRQGMVPLLKAGEISAVHALDILEQLIYGMYEDMELCLLPENSKLCMEDIYVDTVTWRIRVVYRPAAPLDENAAPSVLIRRRTAAAASGLIRISEIRAKGYLERAVRILLKDEASLDRVISSLEALKRRAYRLSGPEGAKLDFGNIFV